MFDIYNLNNFLSKKSLNKNKSFEKYFSLERNQWTLSFSLDYMYICVLDYFVNLTDLIGQL